MITQIIKGKGPFGTILVADDTQVMRHACQRALERAGHRVVMASHGEEAIAVARAERIDVALLDIKMPGPSGIDVLRTIKQEQPLVEAIMMTAYATQDVAEEATHLGASSFLTKPFSNIKTLTDAVSQAITRKRLREEGFHGPVRIEDLLAQEGMVSAEKIAEARERAKEWSVSIREALVRMGAVQPEDLDWVLAKSLDIPFVRLNEKDIDPLATQRIPAYVARRYHLIPILIEERNIHVAVDDPFNREGLEIVKRRTGLNPIMVKGYGPEIAAMIQYFYPDEKADLNAQIAAVVARADPEILMEILESARIMKIDKVHFEPVSEGKRRLWSFSIEGLIAEEGEDS